MESIKWAEMALKVTWAAVCLGKQFLCQRERGANVTLVLGPMKELCLIGVGSNMVPSSLAPGPCSISKVLLCVQGSTHNLFLTGEGQLGKETGKGPCKSPLHSTHTAQEAPWF